DVASSADRLSSLGVSAVIAGFDTGVELADHLSAHLGLASNDVALSAARRDKALMTETVASHGLRAMPYCVSSDLREVVHWSQGRWPVIAKPRRSAASDGVALCHTADDL